MITQNMKKFQRELNSLQGLTTMNIVFGGIAMAFGIALVTQNISSIVTSKSLQLSPMVLVAVGLIVAAISIRWLILSAEMLEGVVDMKEDYFKEKKTLNEESLTGFIVRMMSHYREKKATIKRMMLISKIAGICFAISGTYNLVMVVTNVIAGVPQFDVVIQVVGAGVSFILASVSFAIPHFLGKYSKVWDYRLEESARAERDLKKHLEGSLR